MRIIRKGLVVVLSCFLIGNAFCLQTGAKDSEDCKTHEWGTTKVEKATCAKKGKRYKKCKKCGKEKTIRVLKKLEHSWSITNKPATCTTNGLITSKCSVCGKTIRKTVKKKSHNFKVVKVLSPSCKGAVKLCECEYCKKQKRISSKKKTPHNFQRVSDGTFKCEYCGEVKELW